MNAFVYTRSHGMKTLCISFTCILLALSTPNLTAQSDNFNDGSDQPEWTRYDPIGSAIGSFARFQPTNGAYRISVPASPDPRLGPARAGALRTEVTYSNFFVSVDLVDWNENVNQAFGIIARIKEPGLGSTDGYAMTYNFGGHDIDMTWFTDEDPRSPKGGGIGPNTGDKITNFVKGKVYRFEFAGKGDTLKARVYQLPDTMNPVASITGTDTHYSQGYSGLLIYDNSGGGGIADATYDNYLALDYEPARPRIEILSFEYRVWWPIEFSDFVLEKTDNLAAGTWTEVAVTADATSYSYYADLFDDSPRYYRLMHRPPP
jgi:hypothetical protein